MKKMVVVAVLALGLVLMSIPVLAIELGTNITIYDGSGSGTGWYGAQEDGEVEPNCVATQAWDLEGFFLKGTTLTMVGGFDFAGNTSQPSGDIFLDIDGDYKAGDKPDTNKIEQVSNSYGYDYALDLDFANKQYTIYSLDENSQLNSVFYAQNQGSTPWEYVSDATDIVGTYTLGYDTGLSNAAVGGLLGGVHNAVAIDLGLTGINFSKGFLAHFTMRCGNDNLIGVSPVPEPQTLLLMGIGLLGLAFVGRKKMGDRA